MFATYCMHAREKKRSNCCDCCYVRYSFGCSLFRYLNSPVTFDLTSEIVKASNTLLNFTSDNAIEGADSIPKDLIADARGLAFITFVKVRRARA